ncbi:hypothetical protein EJ07DRAFT_104964, partial [Lizonia empirigonia]
EETHNQGFEEIDFHNFKPVDYPRKMSWKKRNGEVGRVAIGEDVLNNQNTDEDKDDVTLKAGWIVLVDKMTFKLTKA